METLWYVQNSTHKSKMNNVRSSIVETVLTPLISSIFSTNACIARNSVRPQGIETDNFLHALLEKEFFDIRNRIISTVFSIGTRTSGYSEQLNLMIRKTSSTK